MICIYPPDCTDFSTNGAGTLTPSSCTVTETLNGEYRHILLRTPLRCAGIDLCSHCHYCRHR